MLGRMSRGITMRSPEELAAERDYYREQGFEQVRKAATLEAKLRKAIQTLERYRNCRHGSIDCFCTKEARDVLAEYP